MLQYMHRLYVFTCIIEPLESVSSVSLKGNGSWRCAVGSEMWKETWGAEGPHGAELLFHLDHRWVTEATNQEERSKQ